MRATLMYEAGDVRIEDVPDSAIKRPTDALAFVARFVPETKGRSHPVSAGEVADRLDAFLAAGGDERRC
jgi:hypothetical protein